MRSPCDIRVIIMALPSTRYRHSEELWPKSHSTISRGESEWDGDWFPRGNVLGRKVSRIHAMDLFFDVSISFFLYDHSASGALHSTTPL